MRSVLFVTGTRADFGKLEPLATKAIAAQFQVGFFVTGMHMLQKYGLTRVEVERLQGVSNHHFINQKPGDGQDIIFAKTIQGFSDFVAEHKPDLVVVHGDRIEATACALVCATNYIRCAHIEGGEVSGSIDELFRHCNSKLCTYHFVSNDQAKKRVLSLGEHSDRVFVIGSPELDTHAKPSVSLAEVKQHYDIAFDEYGIVVFHPITSELQTIHQQVSKLFDALIQSNRHFVVIKSNNDPGSDQIFSVLESLPKNHFKVLPSMRFRYFSTLLRNAKIVVGNSSLGVREAPFLGVPSIDIGTRQNLRSQTASIYHLKDVNNSDEFLQKLHANWGKTYSKDTSFGSGDAAQRFTECIQNDSFWQIPLQKQFETTHYQS